jgi:hypothetical protein
VEGLTLVSVSFFKISSADCQDDPIEGDRKQPPPPRSPRYWEVLRTRRTEGSASTSPVQLSFGQNWFGLLPMGER